MNVRMRPTYLVVVAAALILAGCVIDNLTGPITVRLGDAATYSMRYSEPTAGSTNVTPVIAMDVPIGWTLTSSSYTGTANGGPITGSGFLVGANPTGCVLPASSPGYQRLYVTTAMIPNTLPSDSATVLLTFLAQGSPGNYTLGFWGLATASFGSSCASSPTTIAVSVLDVQPVGLVEDAHASGTTISNVNSVLEPGETVLVNPSWQNNMASPLALTGTASAFDGPAGATYTLLDSVADYGTIAPGATADSFSAGGPSYRLFVSNPATRPAAHWDATLLETLSNGIEKTWTLHVGQSFSDVPVSNVSYTFVENIFHKGITTGCAAGLYCPAVELPRWQMAIFLARSILGSGVTIPTAGTVSGVGPYDCTSGGISLFTDVAPTNVACPAIHYIYSQGITTGCGPGIFCPNTLLPRWQMAIFLARSMLGPGVPIPTSGSVSGVGTYDCTAGGNSLFADVPTTDVACPAVHYIYSQGVTTGCGAGIYCPNTLLPRWQMAIFLVRAFHMPFLH